MATTRGFSVMLGWRRVLLVLGISAFLSLFLKLSFPNTSMVVVVARAMLVGIVAMLAFGFFEQWPAREPRWIARWVLQVGAVVWVIPWTVFWIYIATTAPDQPHFWREEARLSGFMLTTVTGLLVAPWVAVAALFRKSELQVRTQAMAFEQERNDLERKALDSRLRLLQAQVEPHFLFNTLANVRELVDSGSPQASSVLDTLIAYLRAAVPRLNDPSTTLGQEVQLVRAYLELMHMRMPDRLQFALDVEPAALAMRCPPTTLLTLVENAVRHGIDPSEEGGRIDVRVQVRDGRCRVEVRDTGMGLRHGSESLGTGLASLRERLELVFGGDAQLRLVPLDPKGACAEVDFPAQASPA